MTLFHFIPVFHAYIDFINNFFQLFVLFIPPIRLNSLIHLLSKMACFFAAGAIYTSHLVEIASNCQLTRMAGKFHVRANKVVGTHQEPKLFV